jgi:hypothetical protein
LGAEDCAEYLTAYERYGAHNDPEQVSRLQIVLSQFEGANIQITGVFDAATLAAVDAFQAKYADEILAPWSLKGPTGYVYYTTRKKINEVFCHGTKGFPLTEAQIQEIQKVRVLNEEGVSSEAGEYKGASYQSTPAAAKGTSITQDSIGSQTTKGTSVTKGATIASSTASSTGQGGDSWWSKFLKWLFGR